MVATALLLSGCTKEAAPEITEDSPLVSTAQGLGDAKVDEALFSVSQFSDIYDSTNGAISFKKMDTLDWEVKRVLKAPEGEKLPDGDNFTATAKSNFSYSDTIKDWIEELVEEDGWTATNEVKPKPRSDEEQYVGTKEDYRTKPYSVDLTKGKTTMNVDIENNVATVTINSQ